MSGLEGEVLESLDQVVVSGWAADRGIHIGGNLGMSVDRRGAGLVVGHGSELKDI
jgi:hypothetical protein